MTRRVLALLFGFVLLGAVLLGGVAPTAASARPAAVLESPSDATQAPRDGRVPVVVEAASDVRVQLVTGAGRSRRVVDLTDRLVRDGRELSTELGPDDLEPGISQVRVRGAGRSGRARFSWEPEVDAATAERCDVIDPARCLLPFPNDRFTVADAATDTGRRVDLDVASMPANASGTPIDPTQWNRNDGFSPGSMILASVPGVDPAASGIAPVTDIGASLDRDAPIVLLDADTGERHPYWSELDANAPTPDEQALIVRPAVNLTEGHRYVIGLRDLHRADGSAMGAERGFALYRDDIPTFIPGVEERRDHMTSLFRSLRREGVVRRDLVLAWDFTVASERNLSERMLHIRDDAFAALGDEAPAFEVDAVEEFPDPVVEPELLRRVTGTFRVPNYLTGGGGPGTSFTNGEGDRLPSQNGEQVASFICTVPRSVVSAAGDVVPARPTIYGHGLLGSNSEVSSGNVQAMGVEHNRLHCATKWIGFANEDIGNAVAILQDFSRFPTSSDRVQQGFLNTLFLGRLMIHDEGFASSPGFQVDGAPVIDTSGLFYDGNSQGGILGGAVTAVAQDWTRAVLGVPGMNYSTLLNRSIDFDVYSTIFEPAYPSALDRQLVLSIVQMLWDRSEANGYAAHMTDDPYPGTPAHQVLLHVAYSDQQVANATADVMARTIGAAVRQPALAPGRSLDVEPYWGIPAVPNGRYDGSAMVVWDSGNPPPPPTNLAPREGDDPHGRPRSQPAARAQKAAFLQLDGTFVDTCADAPCLAP